MAGITLEGKLWIDLGDVYAWVESRGTSVEWMTGMRFDIGCDALVLLSESDNDALEIDAAEFWTWVIDKQLPGGIAGYETVFGVPKVEGSDFVVSFAASNEGDPRNWSAPPECLTEWKQVATVAAV